MKKNISYLFIFLLFSGFVRHKYYVSVTEIYVKKDKLEIIMRVFPDDMENTLKDTYSLKTGLMSTDAKAFLNLYLHDHFVLSSAGRNLPYTLEGVLQDDGFFVILMEVKNSGNINQLCITDSVLTALFDEQKNIVHLLYGNNKKQSFILQKPDLSVCADLKD